MALTSGEKIGITVSISCIGIILLFAGFYACRRYLRKKKYHKMAGPRIPVSDVSDQKMDDLREKEHSPLAIRGKSNIGNVKTTGIPKHADPPPYTAPPPPPVLGAQVSIPTFLPVVYYDVAHHDYCRFLEGEGDPDEDTKKPSRSN